MARLLVSVQNKHEAVMAHEAGVAMIDAKDAARGSFAPCDLTTLQDIARACPHATLNAALGPCFSSDESDACGQLELELAQSKNIRLWQNRL